jgi:hypothetical protein
MDESRLDENTDGQVARMSELPDHVALLCEIEVVMECYGMLCVNGEGGSGNPSPVGGKPVHAWMPPQSSSRMLKRLLL